MERKRTFERGETTGDEQLEITQLALAEEQRGERLGLGGQLGLARQIAREEVLEDAAVGSVGHCSGPVSCLADTCGGEEEGERAR